MTEERTIRETRSGELSQILAIYPLAFPDEELRPIVSKLIEGAAEVLSLAAFQDNTLIGHIIYTICNGEGENDNRAGALLAPLCVLKENQNEGVGSALVKQGLERLESIGTRQVFVLGDPNYYGRFGFQAEQHVMPPYQLPEEWVGAWQSMVLSGAKPLKAGQCLLPEAWLEPALWLP